MFPSEQLQKSSHVVYQPRMARYAEFSAFQPVMCGDRCVLDAGSPTAAPGCSRPVLRNTRDGAVTVRGAEEAIIWPARHRDPDGVVHPRGADREPAWQAQPGRDQETRCARRIGQAHAARGMRCEARDGDRARSGGPAARPRRSHGGPPPRMIAALRLQTSPAGRRVGGIGASSSASRKPLLHQCTSYLRISSSSAAWRRTRSSSGIVSAAWIARAVPWMS
ncbi:hypothetical protein B7759_05472 [Burkholderia glumae]|nr:hypothetical protein KS03_4195 [Burkholderia glumae LMG 2196 = ATCC 33617]QKM56012.1 hypothetical protein CG017_04075 [Burkholderia glumae]QTP36833.1 hypothetical protein B7759_05472 [Burkholderia glumae]